MARRKSPRLQGASTTSEAGPASAAIDVRVEAARAHANKRRSQFFPHDDKVFERAHRGLARLADASWSPVRDRVAREIEAAIAGQSVEAATFSARLLAVLARDDECELRGDFTDLAVRLAGELVKLPAGTEHLANAISELLEAVRHEVSGETRPRYGEVVLQAASCKEVAANLNLLFDGAADFLGPAANVPLVGIIDREIGIAVRQMGRGPGRRAARPRRAAVGPRGARVDRRAGGRAPRARRRGGAVARRGRVAVREAARLPLLRAAGRAPEVPAGAPEAAGARRRDPGRPGARCQGGRRARRAATSAALAPGLRQSARVRIEGTSGRGCGMVRPSHETRGG